MVSNSVQATERVFSVSGLSSNTQYHLKITAHNNAGFAVALYNFTTHSALGSNVIILIFHAYLNKSILKNKL